MLGKIISIEDNTVKLKLEINLEESKSIMNLYVLIEDSEKKLIGEITDIKDGLAIINLLGEFSGERFLFGVSKKPAFSATTKLIPTDKMKYVIGMPNYDDKKDLSKLTVAELKSLAKEKNIDGYTAMKKAELLDALK